MSKTTYPARLIRHKTLGTLEWEIAIGKDLVFVPVFPAVTFTHYGPYELIPDGDASTSFEYVKLQPANAEKEK